MSTTEMSPEVLNMYVYGEIVTDSHWFFGSEDDVVTRNFLKDLKAYPNATRINVYINSPGGEVFAAVSIARQLKQHKAEVHTYLEGITASAATIIALSGDVVHMSSAGLFMIHLPSMGASGNRNDLAQATEALSKVEAAITNVYLEKCNLEKEELTAMLEKEAWLTADEAYQYGFVDVIEKLYEKPEDALAALDESLFNMNGVQFKISAFADQDAIKAKLAQIQNSLGESEGGADMGFQAFYNALPVNQRTLIDEEIQNKISNAIADQTTTLTAQVTNLTTQVTTLTNSLAEEQGLRTAAEQKVTDLQNSNGAPDADTVFLNSLAPEAKQAVLNARQATLEAQKALEAVQNVQKFETFKNSLKAFDNLPFDEAQTKALFNISNNCEEDYKALSSLFTVANNAVNQLGESFGADGEPQAGANAYDQIDQLVQAEMKANTELSYNDAFNNVVTKNPGLYDAYRNGQ